MLYVITLGVVISRSVAKHLWRSERMNVMLTHVVKPSAT